MPTCPKKMQYFVFPKKERWGDIKGRLEIFQNFICFGKAGLPLSMKYILKPQYLNFVNQRNQRLSESGLGNRTTQGRQKCKLSSIFRCASISYRTELYVTHGGTLSCFPKHINLACLASNSFRPPIQDLTSDTTFPSHIERSFRSFLVHIYVLIFRLVQTLQNFFHGQLCNITKHWFCDLDARNIGRVRKAKRQIRDLWRKATIIGKEAEALKIVSSTQNYFLGRGYGLICMMLLSSNTNKQKRN